MPVSIHPRPSRASTFRTLATLVVLAVLASGFLALAAAVVEGRTAGFDTAVILALRNPADPADPRGPPGIQEVGRDLTALGGVGALTILTVAVALFLWLRGERRTVLVLLVSIGGGRIASSLLKLAFDRPRPHLVPYGSIVSSSSFPSTHAMMATIAYLTLALLLARAQSARALKVYLVALAAFLALAVGASRVYLGVHWPSDVLAGWIVGLFWIVGVFALARPPAEAGSPAPPALASPGSAARRPVAASERSSVAEAPR